jgi:hypothetical protein
MRKDTRRKMREETASTSFIADIIGMDIISGYKVQRIKTVIKQLLG